MTALANPYSPGKPVEQDHRFIDQDRVLEKIERCLKNNKSCAIIGGAGMGKTSVLKHVKRMFSSAAQPTVFRFIPIYFRPDLRRAGSLGSVYQQLIDETVSQSKVWLKSCSAHVMGAKSALNSLNLTTRLMMTKSAKLDENKTWADFEKDLCAIIGVILSSVSDTKLLFLLDDIFRIRDEGYRNTFVERWLQLLDTDLGFYLTIVITSLKDFFDQFNLRSPEASTGPTGGYYTVLPICLHVFEQKYSYEAVKSSLEDTLNLELTNQVANEIHNLTGGHPFLLQTAMRDLWFDAKEGKSIDIACVQNYKPNWEEECREIYRWIQDMIIYENPLLMPIFSLLVTKDETWELTSIAEAIKGQPVSLRHGHRLPDALQTLTSWGVVREVRKSAYRVSGKLFREWFREWLKLLSATQVDEMNYRSQIDELEDHITKTIYLLDQYRDNEGVAMIREQLKKELATLGTDRTQLNDLEKSFLHRGDPRRDNEFRELINGVQRIKNYMHFEIRRQLNELGIQTDDICDNLVA